MSRQFEECFSDVLSNWNTVMQLDLLDNFDYNDFFHPNLCHICKEPLTGNSKSCNICHMISYCGDSHKWKHFFEHKAFCRFITQHLKSEWRSLAVSTSEWIYKRYELLYQVSQTVGYNLPLHEMQMIIFAKSCYDCHRQIGLQSCKICLSENYCDEHERDFEEHHASKCEMLKLHLNLKIINLRGIKFSQFSNFPKQEKSFNDMEDYIKNYVRLRVKLNWDKEDYIHSDYVSGPLTLYNVMKKMDLLNTFYINQKKHYKWFVECIIHIISTNSLERKYIKAWEILLHLLDRIKRLTIVLIGTSSQEENISISLCSFCESRQQILTIESYPRTYIEYVATSSFQEPNVIITSQAHFHPALEGSWFSNSVLKIQLMKCPYILTAESQNIAEQNIRSIQKILSKNIQPIYSAPNIFKSYMPCRILDTDCIGYRNAYITVYKDLKDDEPLLEMYRLDTLSTIWSYKWLDNVDRYNDFFFPNICHVCKRNTGNLTPCDDCYMISYCGKAHKSKHFSEHKRFCTFLKDYLQMQSTKAKRRSLAVFTPDWFKKRHDFLYKTLEYFSYNLPLYVIQMIIFAKSCYACDQQISLKSCNKCYSENYCDKHQRGFENHHTASKCKMLTLCLGLKTLNLNFNQFLTFDSFPDPEKSFVDMYNFIQNYVLPYAHRDVTNKNWTNFEYTHSDYVSGPLTLYSVMKKNDLLHILYNEEKMSYSQCIIHIIASSVETRYVRAWEILLHLLQNIKHLIIVLIGQELQEENINVSLCNICKGRKQFRIEIYPMGYNLYQCTPFFQTPNVVIMFQAHFSSGTMFSWKNNILTSDGIKCPYILTAGSKNIMEENIRNVRELIKCAKPIYSAPNIFQSFIPYRLLHTDNVGYRNAHVTIWKNLKKLGEFLPKEPQPSTSKDI